MSNTSQTTSDSTSNPNTNTDSSSPSTMPKIPISSSRATQLIENLTSIQTRITQALSSTTSSSTHTTHTTTNPPRLVAVSKLKPASDILALHNAPTSHLHFGENYVQELVEKSTLLPRSIRWHFIGGLQSNKCASLAKIPNLWAVESVDSLKKANLLDKGRGEVEEDGKEKLRVFVQVNTSGEESKSGVDPKSSDLLDLCRAIKDDCENLRLQGLMTIGAIARSKATTEENVNEDFVVLRESRDWVAGELGVDDGGELELSMGMSEDFEGAIVQGSDEVRVGSTIFGERPPRKEAKVLEETEEAKA